MGIFDFLFGGIKGPLELKQVSNGQFNKFNKKQGLIFKEYTHKKHGKMIDVYLKQDPDGFKLGTLKEYYPASDLNKLQIIGLEMDLDGKRIIIK